ncbi:hypothetical protein JQC92_06775 [Shewanella sp. 202IG2-18]|nr:hypothetical protein [Parashewanella hymeniacidonis]
MYYKVTGSSLLTALSTNAYWSQNIPRSTVEKSIKNSLCFGVFEGSTQVGFARLVTDKATFAYLADVFNLNSA